MEKREVKRRAFLKVSAVAVLGTAATACGAKEKIVTQIVTQEVEKIVEATKIVEKEVEKQVQVTVEVPKSIAEPPFFQAKVAAGKLPPIDERLPESPVVVGGREAIGVYGGEIRMSHFDPTWWTSCYDLTSERLFQYSDSDFRTIYANVLESWEVTSDGKEWTFHMRKGEKWSDGEPMTSEDVRFWWEDMQMNKDIQTAPDWQFRFGGEPMKVDIIDDFTYKFTFAAPFGNFAAHMTRWHENTGGPIYPSHFLKKYHNKYADKATLDAMVAERKVDSWVNVFNDWKQWGTGTWWGPTWGGLVGTVKDYPVNCAWMVVDNPSEGIYLWERNPYYWKVDLVGNQLPYIDTLRYDYVANVEANKLKIAQGELDIVGQHDVTIADYPFYKENEATSNYQVADLISCMSDRYVYFPQHYVVNEDKTPDEGWNKLIQENPEFIQALSVAIDRNEINESLFYGLASVGQICPIPSSKYYKPKYGTAFAQYDPTLAGTLLDKIGCTKGSDGMRVRPDGKPLQIMVEHAGSRVGPVAAQMTEMITTYWRDIGIDATGKEILENLYNDRMNNYMVYCGLWHADRCTDMLVHIEPQWYIPTATGQGGACTAWAKWYLAADKTTAGLIEPPQWMKDLYGYFEQMTSVVSEDERVQWGQKMFDYLADRPLEIGLLTQCPAPLLFNKNLRNLPRPKTLIGWDTWGLSTHHPEGFFFEGGVRA
jgi:peptide/nickel transport system substrate-binding protein